MIFFPCSNSIESKIISSELKGRFFLASYSIIVFRSFLFSGGTSTVFNKLAVLLIVNDIGTPD